MAHPRVDRMIAVLPEMLADIEQLLRCESPSADPGTSRRSAEVVAAIGTARLGVEPEWVTRGGFSHLRWRLGAGPARVLVLGHHDTVWPVGSLSEHPFSIVDGVLRGPGCFDMKAGLAMAFQGIAALADTAGVTLLVTGDEELGAPSSRELIEQEARNCDAVFVLEASADGGALKTERKGVSLYEVQVLGRAAHAGLEPEAGINASIELARQVLAIAALGDGALGTTVTPTVLTAGTTSNTVPASASVMVDARMWTAAEQERVDRNLRALRAVTPGAQVRVSGGPNRAPLESIASAELFARAVGHADRLGLGVIDSAAVGGASDGNFTAGLGVPTLDGLGAVGGGAHADNEHVLIAELPGRTALLTELIAEVLDGEPRQALVLTETRQP